MELEDSSLNGVVINDIDNDIGGEESEMEEEYIPELVNLSLYFTVPHGFPWTPHGLLIVPMESSWSPHGLLMESSWSLCGVLMESSWSPGGVFMESSCSPCGVSVDSLDSMRTP